MRSKELPKTLNKCGKPRRTHKRDLGITAHAQIVLHYHIVSYGTLAAYAKALGMKEAAQTLHDMLEQVKAQDQKYTQLATQLLA